MIDQTAQRTMLVPGQGLIPRGRPTIDHNEYPKMMTHPQFQPGKPSEAMKHPSGFTYHGIGTPIRFPHVLVKTPDDEAYHASLGYESQGKCDAAAFDRAVGAGQIPDQSAYKPLEYPKWVQGKLCNDRAQEDAWIAKCGGPAVEQAPALDIEVATLLDRPDLASKTPDQPRIEELETKIERLTELLVKATAPAEPVTIKAEKKPKLAKKTRKPVVRTAQQKRDHSEAIKAGMARKRALTESKPSEQGDAPIG